MNAGAWKLETERGVIMDGDKSEHRLEAIPVMGSDCDIIAVRSFAGLTDREYDADGRLVKTMQYEVVETDGPEEVNLMWVTEYTYLEFDDHGNWIRRKQTDTDQIVEYVNETEVSREIEYY